MKATARDEQQRWLIAAGVAAALAGVLVILIQGPRFQAPVGALAGSAVELQRIAATDVAPSEEAALRDLTPLFLPTEWNASGVRIPQREPEKTFFDRETERFAFSEMGWSIDLALAVTLNGKPVVAAGPRDILAADNPADDLSGFGRSELKLPTLPARGGLVEIVALGTGRQVLAVELPAQVRPPTDALWAPVEFLAGVDPAGLIAPLRVTTRSGVEEVDGFFRDYLAKTFRLGERLTPGFYRVVVAP